jgi:hypothetical protein
MLHGAQPGDKAKEVKPAIVSCALCLLPPTQQAKEATGREQCSEDVRVRMHGVLPKIKAGS